MNISPQTIDALKILQSVNLNIKVKPGKILSSVSQSGKIAGCFEIDDEFEREFSVHDLGRFVAALQMFKNPQIKFEDRSMLITGENPGEIRYWYSVAPNMRGGLNLDILLSREKSALTSFHIPAQILKSVKEAIQKLGLPHVILYSDRNKLFLKVAEIDNMSGNTFAVEIADTTLDLKMVFLSDLFSFLSGESDVKIISKGHMKIENKEKKSFFVFGAEKIED